MKSKMNQYYRHAVVRVEGLGALLHYNEMFLKFQ